KGHWVRPKLVAEVAFTEWTGDRRIRHPVFRGLRADKDPLSITREEGKPVEAAENKAGGIAITHGERVVDAASGATKLDLVRYYEGIAAHMLPHLAGRPIALVRAPTGIGGELFFQKHGEKISIEGIRQLPRDYWPGHPAMLEIASKETLVSAAQMNVIEFHTWSGPFPSPACRRAARATASAASSSTTCATARERPPSRHSRLAPVPGWASPFP